MTLPNAYPPIDFSKLPPVDPDRFTRALSLEARALDNAGQYLVVNPADPLADGHNVDLHSSDVPRCDCGDHLYRDTVCKHILCCLIREEHPVAVDMLVDHFRKRRML